MKKIISKLIFPILAFLLHSCLCNTAMAQVTLYSTFGPGHTFDTGAGYLISSGSTTFDGLPRWVAARFTSPYKAHLTRIDLAASIFTDQPYTNQLRIQLYSNVSGRPGAVLESWLITILPPDGSSKTVSVVSTSGVMLQSGKVYWVVLGPGPLGPGVSVTDNWSLNNVPEGTHSLYGTVLGSTDGSSWNDFPCCPHNQVTLPAFEVRGKLVGVVKNPLVPIIPSQIVRLTVVAGPITPPPGVPVEGVLGFLGPDGNPIGPSSQVSLSPGQTASLDLNANALPALSQLGRMEIRPVVTPPAGSVGFNGEIRSSVEVLDSATGFGSVFVAGSESLPNAPVFAPQGLAGGQTMSLNVFSTDSTPCVATLGFLDSNGGPIGPTIPVNLSGGQSASLDLNSTSLGIPSGAPARIELQPQVTLGSANGSSIACPASVEVFDNQTGRTRTYQPGNAPLSLPAVQ